jgi:hypothetical protein
MHPWWGSHSVIFQSTRLNLLFHMKSADWPTVCWGSPTFGGKCDQNRLWSGEIRIFRYVSLDLSVRVNWQYRFGLGISMNQWTSYLLEGTYTFAQIQRARSRRRVTLISVLRGSEREEYFETDSGSFNRKHWKPGSHWAQLNFHGHIDAVFTFQYLSLNLLFNNSSQI